MKYSIRSDMVTEMTPKRPWLVRHVFLCRVLRVVSWLVLPFAYLGAFIAPAMILSIPFQVFHYHHFSLYAFRIMACLMATLILLMLTMALIALVRLFRRNIIYLEAIALSLGLVFAVVVVIWIFPPK
jgi:hypothetical protein